MGEKTCLWDLRSPDVPVLGLEDGGEVTACSFSSSGNFFVCSGEAGIVRMYTWYGGESQNNSNNNNNNNNLGSTNTSSRNITHLPPLNEATHSQVLTFKVFIDMIISDGRLTLRIG